MLINLLTNAVKFSFPDGTVSIEISYYKTNDNKRTMLEFKVIDHGLGISPEDLKNLF